MSAVVASSSSMTADDERLSLHDVIRADDVLTPSSVPTPGHPSPACSGGIGSVEYVGMLRV
jgi:hypothetical protein